MPGLLLQLMAQHPAAPAAVTLLLARQAAAIGRRLLQAAVVRWLIAVYRHLLPAVDTPMVACLLLQAAAAMHIAACLLLQAAAEITGLQLLPAVVTIPPAALQAAGTRRYRSATIYLI